MQTGNSVTTHFDGPFEQNSAVFDERGDWRLIARVEQNTAIILLQNQTSAIRTLRLHLNRDLKMRCVDKNALFELVSIRKAEMIHVLIDLMFHKICHSSKRKAEATAGKQRQTNKQHHCRESQKNDDSSGLCFVCLVCLVHIGRWQLSTTNLLVNGIRV